MNHRLAERLPLIHPPSKSWYRSVDQRFRYEPPPAADAATRFNPGDRPELRIMYFAPSELLARGRQTPRFWVPPTSEQQSHSSVSIADTVQLRDDAVVAATEEETNVPAHDELTAEGDPFRARC